MVSFEPSEDQKLLLEALIPLRKKLEAGIRAHEKQRGLPDDICKTAHEMGFAMAHLPTEAGGAGLGLVTAVLVDEAIAMADPSAGTALPGPGSFGIALTELGTMEQQARLLAPFTESASFGTVAFGEASPCKERPGLSCTAIRDGNEWVLRGKKGYVTNADRAGSFVVIAQVDDAAGWNGLGAFVVKKGAIGLSATPRATTLGLDLASFGGIELYDVRVPDADRLLGGADFSTALLRFIVKNALVHAARSVGLSVAAFDTTRAYVETRRAFGKPIAHFQAVAFTIADRAMDIEAARALLLRAAWAWDANEPDALLASAWAIAHAHETAMRCGDDAVQLHGGSGFMRDYPVEKYMRDGKQLGLCGMPAENARALAATLEIGTPLDLALIVPSAESQNAFL